jgi:hypothetical protein
MVSDEHVVDHRSLARSPPWAGRGAEVDRGSKGAKGGIGTAIDVPPPRLRLAAPRALWRRKTPSSRISHRLTLAGCFRGGNRMFPAQMGLLFTRPPPASSAAAISKMPLKPPRSSSTDSSGVANSERQKR